MQITGYGEHEKSMLANHFKNLLRDRFPIIISQALSGEEANVTKYCKGTDNLSTTYSPLLPCSDVLIYYYVLMFTYWCHECCLRFRQDNLVVDGRQMVSLVSVHGRGSLFDIYNLIHFPLVPVGFTGQYFCVLRGH